MNNFEELKKAALAVLELNDVKGCWQSSLLETKDRGAVHAIVTEHGDNVCEATGDTVIDSVIIDYIESVSPTATLALIAQLEGAQKERDDLREKVNQADSEWHKMADRILSAGKRAEKAETALSAANEKLSKPVVLPSLYDPQISGDAVTRAECFANNRAVKKCAVAVKAAGFKVEGE
ncbi:TPA: hypothetical protein ACSBN8_002542 [Yersinia enterocolitica]